MYKHTLLPKTLILVFLIALLNACTTHQASQSPRTNSYRPAYIEPDMKSVSTAKKEIAKLQSFLKKGDCIEAARSGDRLVRDFISDDGSFEQAVISSICICHLEQAGDLSRFSTCSEELAEYADAGKYLAPNSQFVLELKARITDSYQDTGNGQIDHTIRQALDNIIPQDHLYKDND